MPEGIKVDIDDALIISALNRPGGDVFEWRDRSATAIAGIAENKSPVNDFLNARHRGSVVGTYKASWSWNRVGSNQHRVRATVFNFSDHADLVEYGRKPSSGWERFSWSRWRPPGKIKVVKNGTLGYRGKHVLRDAANIVMRVEGGGTVPPLV